MERFTHHYRSTTNVDFTDLPWWDLCAALRTVPQIATWGLDATAEEAMFHGHRVFVAMALARVSDRAGAR